MEDPVPSGPGCGWPDRAQTGAPPTPPLAQGLYQQHRRACAPSADPTMRHDWRATSELDQQTMRTPSAGRPSIMTGTGRSGGTLSPGRPGLRSCQPEAACVRGPWQERPRPQERDRRACGTERVISPARLDAFSIWGRCGVSPLEAVARKGNGSGPGDGFPRAPCFKGFVAMEIVAHVRYSRADRWLAGSCAPSSFYALVSMIALYFADKT